MRMFRFMNRSLRVCILPWFASQKHNRNEINFTTETKHGRVYVAGLCGWNGDAAFRKAFASRFGVPPLRWARENRNGRRP